MRASEFIIDPDTTLIGKLAKTGKIVQVLKQKQGPAFAKNPDEVWTLIDTDPSRTNKISDNAKWIPADTEFEWVREYLKKIDEFAPGGTMKPPTPPITKKKDPWEDDDRSIYPRKIKQLLDAGNKVDSRVPGAMGHIFAADDDSIRLKPLNKPYSQKRYAWYIDQDRDVKLLLKQEQPGYYVLYDRDWLPHGPMNEEQLDEGLRDWIAALAATGAMALGTPAVAKQVPTTTAVSQQAYNQISQALATPAAQTLKKTAIKAGIVGTELAQFMAQCAHETANFTSLEEFGGSLDFRKYDPKYNPRKAKQLGNKVAGDGAKYKGRGFIQLTGRDNYKRAGQALGLPLEQRPELVERPDVAAKVAVWFWQNRVAPKVASFHDTQQATKPINPGMRGLQDRHTKFNAIKQGAMATPKDMAPRGRRI